MFSSLRLDRKIEVWIPGKARGKGSIRSTVTKSNKVHTFKDTDTRAYEGYLRLTVAERAREIGLHVPHQGPVILSAYFLYAIPQRVTRRGKSVAYYPGVQKLTKPDPTNLLKSLEDACSGIIWLDDCQVIGYHEVAKGYGRIPGMLLVAYLYDEPEPPPVIPRRKKK